MNQHTINGIAIAYEDVGAGRPVLWVHGFPLTHAMWRPQVDGLRDDVRHIVPDLRGFGRSGLPAGPCSMDVYADDLAALLDVLKLDRAVIAGLSMGGYVAMAFARRHARRIAALILADTRAGADTPEAGAGRRQTADRVLREGVGVVAATMIEKLIAAATRSQRPALADDLNAIMLSNTPQGVAAALHALADRPDSLASLAAITAPTLVIVGEQDVLTPPAESEKIAAAVRGARLARIADAGHAPNLEQPAAFNDAVRSFLATLPGT